MNKIKIPIPPHKLYEFKPKKNKFALCIPVINEGNRFKKELRKITNFSYPIDIIVADGGSTDGSTDPKFLQKNNVTALLIKKAPGKLSTQLRIAYAYILNKGYEGIITIDGNNKDDPRDIIKFIEKLEEGYDYIQGSRFIKGGKAINTPLLRYIGNRFIHAPLLSFFSGVKLTDTTNGFRAYSRKFLLDSKVNPFREIFENYELLFYLSYIAGKLGYKVIEIPVTRKYPKKSIPTKINFWGNIDILKELLKVIIGYYNL